MKFVYTVKWRAFGAYKKPGARWRTDLRENRDFVKPGTYLDFPERETEVKIIKLERIYLEYEDMHYHTDIIKAIKEAAEEGLTEETAKLIRAAKELGITKEPETLRL